MNKGIGKEGAHMPGRERLVALAAGGLALGAALGWVAGAAHAFGTVNLLGQRAEHEKITRLGLTGFGLGKKTMSEIAGKTGTFGAVGAPDNPVRGLMGRAEAHCDGGDAFAGRAGYPRSVANAAAQLGRCRAWIMHHLRDAVRSAGELVGADGTIHGSEIPTFFSCTYNGKRGRAKCNVLEAMGLALHAAQDFYSHSNWTDRPRAGELSLTNPPGLGHTGRAPWLDPRSKRTFPYGLISGCYEGIPESRHCRDRIRHADLNKDTGSIDVASGSIGTGRTPRGHVNANFARAVKAAIEDTADKWAYFEQRVRSKYGRRRGRLIVCVVRMDTPAGCR
jgi:hypothetical protein